MSGDVHKNIQGGKKRAMLGVELPFGWCLVRGAELRRLQTELREATFHAEVRARIIRQFLEQINRKESP